MPTTHATDRDGTTDALQRLRMLAAPLADGDAAAWAEAVDHVAAEMAQLRASAERCRGQQQQLEAAYRDVQEQHLRYRELFDFAPDAYLVTDPSGIIAEANHAASDLLQARKEFLHGKPLPLYVAAEQRFAFYTSLNQMIRRGVPVHDWEVALRTTRGALVQVALSATQDHDEAGQLVSIRWLLRDLTEQRRSEQALQVEKAFSDDLINTAQAIVLVLDADGRILRSNPYTWSFTGFTEAGLQGQVGWRLLPPEEWEPSQKILRDALVHDTPQSRIGKILTHDGQPLTVAWSIKAVRQTSRAAPVILALGHDITALAEAQQQALQVERLAAVGEVMTSLAHECRNALQRSSACLERLSWRVQEQPEAADLVARARAAQAHLNRLFDDVRSYAAPIALEWERCDLAELWRSTWEEVRDVFPDTPAELREALGDTACIVTADGFRLRQVFRNLLENTFAACPERVVVDIRSAEVAHQGRPAVALAVRDHGPGLSHEQRERIFEAFYTTKTRGSGLGMAIARRILEAHGGTIEVGTPACPGTEILLTIPRSRA